MVRVRSARRWFIAAVPALQSLTSGYFAFASPYASVGIAVTPSDRILPALSAVAAVWAAYCVIAMRPIAARAFLVWGAISIASTGWWTLSFLPRVFQRTEEMTGMSLSFLPSIATLFVVQIGVWITVVAVGYHNLNAKPAVSNQTLEEFVRETAPVALQSQK